jgi:hypothetical protein
MSVAELGQMMRRAGVGDRVLRTVWKGARQFVFLLPDEDVMHYLDRVSRTDAGRLFRFTKEQWRRVPGCGAITASEVMKALSSLGVTDDAATELAKAEWC